MLADQPSAWVLLLVAAADLLAGVCVGKGALGALAAEVNAAAGSKCW
jgi:hypothetical protein